MSRESELMKSEMQIMTAQLGLNVSSVVEGGNKEKMRSRIPFRAARVISGFLIDLFSLVDNSHIGHSNFLC